MSAAVKKVFAQIMDVAEADITIDSSPETISSWDSLKHMQLILALEDEFDVEFPDEAIPEMMSFDAIVKMLTKLSAG